MGKKRNMSILLHHCITTTLRPQHLNSHRTMASVNERPVLQNFKDEDGNALDSISTHADGKTNIR